MKPSLSESALCLPAPEIHLPFWLLQASEKVVHQAQAIAFRNRAPFEGPVHDMRVCLKRMRAFLRLLGDIRENRLFRQEYARLRKAGRQLAPTRENHVLRKTLRGMEVHFQENPRAQDALHILERSNLIPSESPKEEILDGLRGAARALRKTNFLLKEIPWEISGWADLESRVRDSYRKARNRFRKTADDPRVENFHEWRKRTKDLMYQLEFLFATNPQVFRKELKRLKKIADLLGEERDQFELKNFLIKGKEHAYHFSSLITVVLEKLSDEKHSGQKKALKIGRKAFSKRPKKWGTRFHHHWIESLV